MKFHMFYVLVLECCVAQVQTAWDVLSRLTLSWQLCQNCKVKGEKRPVKRGKYAKTLADRIQKRENHF